MGVNILEFNSVILSVVDSHRQLGDCSDFVNFEDLPAHSSKILIGIGFAYVCSYIAESVRVLLISELYRVIIKKLNFSRIMRIHFTILGNYALISLTWKYCMLLINHGKFLILCI